MRPAFAFLLMNACAPLLYGCLLEEGGDGSTSLAAEVAAAEALPVQQPSITATATRDDNLALGNPSSATADASNPNNYLLVKPQFVLSYNNARGTPNWVSWHLSSAWKGDAPRQKTFTTETLLPSTFVKVATSWYTSTGFDRGHLCPSEDRDGSIDDNKATFFMTNIMPQAPSTISRPGAAWKTTRGRWSSPGTSCTSSPGPPAPGARGASGSRRASTQETSRSRSLSGRSSSCSR